MRKQEETVKITAGIMTGIKRAVGILLFFLLLWRCLYVTSNVLVPARNSSDNIKALYYQKKNTVDLLVLGTSHTYRGFYPMTLWEDCGISRIGLGTSLQPFAATYYLLKEGLRVQKPKVVVLELYGCQYENDYGSEKIGLFQSAVNQIPLNFTKLELWWNQLRKDFSWEEQIKYLFPILDNHMRWTELKASDFCFRDYEKGGKPVSNLKAQRPGEEVTGKLELNPTAMEYLKKMIDLCEEKQVPLIGLVIPMADSEDYEKMCARINTACAYAESRGVKVYQMQEVAQGMELDYETDFFNDGHLNISGGRKLTKWFEKELAGELIVEVDDGL